MEAEPPDGRPGGAEQWRDDSGGSRLHHYVDLAGRVDWRVLAGTLLAIALVVIGAFAWGVRTGAPPPLTLPAASPRAATAGPAATEPPGIHVHVAGEVRRPGLYLVPAGSRVAALLDAAGGQTSEADVDRLNLAAEISDGDRIAVPAFGEPIETSVSAGSETSLIDVNRATVSELEALPGIGPSLAAAIVESRARAGPFATIDDLERVAGIGPATVARLRPHARA